MAHPGGRPPLCEVRQGDYRPDVDLAELRLRYPRHARLYGALAERIGGTLTLRDLRRIMGTNAADDRAIAVLRDLAGHLGCIDLEEHQNGGPRFTVTVHLPPAGEALPTDPGRLEMVPLYYNRTNEYESAAEHDFLRYWCATYEAHRETAYFIEEPDWVDEVADVRDLLHTLLRDGSKQDHVRLARYVDCYLRGGVVNMGRERALIDLYRWKMHRYSPYRIRTFLIILPDLAGEIESAAKTLGVEKAWEQPPNIRAIAELRRRINFERAGMADIERPQPLPRMKGYKP